MTGKAEVDFEKYGEFITKITSKESLNVTDFIERVIELDKAGCNIARLDTGASGLASEGGEFAEIVKKLKFQGKEYNEDLRFHMKRELGDIIWYWVTACIALGFNPNEVIEENVKKLGGSDKMSGRYTDGIFNVHDSENRKEGDL